MIASLFRAESGDYLVLNNHRSFHIHNNGRWFDVNAVVDAETYHRMFRVYYDKENEKEKQDKYRIATEVLRAILLTDVLDVIPVLREHYQRFGYSYEERLAKKDKE